jgi:vanillate/3-O-methylgallate O-demethylase
MFDVDRSDPGTEVIVIWGERDEPQKEIRAKVAPAPYKKDNGRIDVRSL